MKVLVYTTSIFDKLINTNKTYFGMYISKVKCYGIYPRVLGQECVATCAGPFVRWGRGFRLADAGGGFFRRRNFLRREKMSRIHILRRLPPPSTDKGRKPILRRLLPPRQKKTPQPEKAFTAGQSTPLNKSLPRRTKNQNVPLLEPLLTQCPPWACPL